MWKIIIKYNMVAVRFDSLLPNKMNKHKLQKFQDKPDCIYTFEKQLLYVVLYKDNIHKYFF